MRQTRVSFPRLKSPMQPVRDSFRDKGFDTVRGGIGDERATAEHLARVQGKRSLEGAVETSGGVRQRIRPREKVS